MDILKAWRLPAAIAVTSGVVAGAALAITDDPRTTYSNDPSGVWVSSDAADAVSHLTPGGVDATIGVDLAEGELRVVQHDDGGAYLVDAAGRVSRVDAGLLEITEEASLPSAGTQLVTGAHRLYAVDPASGTVRELDPLTLTALAPAAEVGDELGTAVVDDEGILWVPDLATGDVVALDGSTVTSTTRVAEPGAAIHLTVVGSVVVAIDPDGVAVVGVDGTAGDPVAVPLRRGGPIAAPRDVAAGTIVPVLGERGALVLVDVAGRGVTSVELDTGDHELGTPEVSADKVWVPDFTTGELIVVELPGGTLGNRVRVSGSPGRFELVVNGDRVYVNDPDSEKAWAIDAGGNVIPAEKYDPDRPGTGTPPPATIPPAPDLPPPPTTTPAAQAPPPTTAPAQDEDEDRGDDDDDDRDRRPPAANERPVITVPPPPVTITTPPTDRGGRGDGGGGDGPPTTAPTDTTTPTTDPATGTTTTTTSTSQPPRRPTGDGSVVGLALGAGDRAVTASWQPPADWYAVTGYHLVLSPGGETADVGAGATSHEFTGLSNGTTYIVTVTAESDDGSGVAVSSPGASPAAGIPPPPTDVVATAGRGSATVRWSSTGGRIDNFVVEVTPTGGAPVSQTVAADARSATFTGLSNGVEHTASVRAVNAPVSSAATPSGAFMPSDVPDAPGSVSAVAASPTSATVSWGPAAANGAAVTDYTITGVGFGPVVVGGSARSATISGLSTGTTYTFTVTATNGVGAGAPAGSNAVLLETMVPSAPGNVGATALDRGATVTWQIPAGNGTTIASFEITGAGTTTVGGGATSAQIGGLANGASYTFSVVAIGANGARSQAATTGAVTPSGTPNPPTNVVASAAGPDAGTLSFSQQSPSEGTTVGRWHVTVSPGGSFDVTSTSGIPLTGLDDNTSYTVTVIALGDNGLNSAPSAGASFTTPSGAPGAVTGVTGGVVFEGDYLDVTWNAAPGATTYIVDVSDGQHYETAATSVSVDTWMIGSYTVTVTPRNSYGDGPSDQGSYRVRYQRYCDGRPQPCIEP